MLFPEGDGPRVSLADISVSENHVPSLLLHKTILSLGSLDLCHRECCQNSLRYGERAVFILMLHGD